MLTPTTNDAEALALAAMAATLTDERRARRFLDLTGLEVDELRDRALAGDRILLAATIAFLESYEPDLVAVAEATGSTPATLVAARGVLEA
jgi:adenine/guanine phosphoribosyltransferase-like PRPP-binding protein